MMLETLESRRLMSVSLNAATQVLTVVGRDVDDTITASVTNATLKVVDNGKAHYFPAAKVKKIAVFAKDGHDAVTLAPSVKIDSYLDSGPNTVIDSGDSLQGGSGRDTIHLRSVGGSARGGAGDDTLFNHMPMNSLYGEAGNDRLVSTQKYSTESGYFGGAGNDTMDYSASTYDLVIKNGQSGVYTQSPDGPPIVNGAGADFLAAFENFTGGSGDDLIYGTAGNNVLRGNGGNDVIRAAGGADTLYGGSGKDALYGDDGNDVFYARDSVHDFVSGGLGYDKAKVDAADAIIGVEALIP